MALWWYDARSEAAVGAKGESHPVAGGLFAVSRSGYGLGEVCTELRE